MPGFLRSIIRLTPARVVGIFIALWTGVAVALATLKIEKPMLLAYIGATLVYSFFIGTWAMLRTVARLRGVAEESEEIDGRLLLETLPVGAMIADGKGRARALNGAWLDLFGLTRNQTEGKNYERFCDPVLRGHLDRVQKSRKPSYDLSLSARRPDGVNVTFIADIIPFQKGLLIAAHPSRQGEASSLRYCRENRFQQLGRISVFFLEKLAAQFDDLPVADAQTPAKILRQVAAFAGDAEEKVGELDAISTIKVVEELVAPLAAWRNVSFIVETGMRLPQVKGRSTAVTTALLALAINALEKAPAQSAVRLTVQEVPDGVELSVTDKGPTLPPERRERIFKPYASEIDLGLAIGRQIAREQGGDLLYYPQEPVGNRFVLRLPLSLN